MTKTLLIMTSKFSFRENQFLKICYKNNKNSRQNLMNNGVCACVRVCVCRCVVCVVCVLMCGVCGVWCVLMCGVCVDVWCVCVLMFGVCVDVWCVWCVLMCGVCGVC